MRAFREHRLSIAFGFVNLVGLTDAVAASGDVFRATVWPFVQRNCMDCHSGDNAKAGFDISRLNTQFDSVENANAWLEVMNEINLGQMPPEDEPRPDATTVFAVAEWIANELREAQKRSRMAGGQILMRRMNREEYLNTVEDLFKLSKANLSVLHEILPTDGTAEGFDRISSALFVDQNQLQQYLQAARYVANLAVRDAPPETRLLEWEARKSLAPPPTTGLAYVEPSVDIPIGEVCHEIRDDGVLVWGDVGRVPSGRFAPKGFVHLPDGKLPTADAIVAEDGFYRLKIRAGADRGKRGEPIRMMILYGRNLPYQTDTTVEIGGSVEQPEEVEVKLFLRAPQEGERTRFEFAFNGLSETRVRHPVPMEIGKKFGEVLRALSRGRATGSPEVAALERDYEIALAKFKETKEPIFIEHPDFPRAELPKILLQSVSIEGPLLDQWPPASHEVIGLKGNEDVSPATFQKIFTSFLPFAHRRRVSKDEMDLIINQCLWGVREMKMDFNAALRLGLEAMLCSPPFLYLHEPRPSEEVRPVNAFELANRLSYFLWNSMPDRELFQSAASDQLKDRSVLSAQVTRMLADPKSKRFVEGFAGQWLDVRRYGSIKPAREYTDYDTALERAGSIEPLAFFEHVLRENRPITDFIDSPYLVINERLALHYGIPGVTGDEFRMVPIPEGVMRGGVLGMAGLMTLLSDGTRTMPVSRASWVREKLFNDPPPPPPPGAGEIQPNAGAGNLTVRERLERHRSEPTCASCHSSLDGYGLALENYDVIGAWRTHANGERFKEGSAPEIDASGKLKSGRTFTDLKSYKKALLEESDAFAEAFASQLLTYALGRPVGAIDRAELDWILGHAKRDQYRMQTFVKAIVAGQLFQTK